MKSKRTILLIIATIATLVLAVVAVMTSLKLQELSTVPVAPNVPVSQPRAAGEACLEDSDCATNERCSEGTCQAGEGQPCGTDYGDCPSGMSCIGGICRVDTGGGDVGTGGQCTVSFVVTAPEIACGDTCATTDDACGSGMTCNQGVCTLTQCVGEADPCNCSGTITCVSKQAFQNTTQSTPGIYQLTTQVTADSEVSRGQLFIYTINYENVSAAAVTGAVINDQLPDGVDYFDGDPGCTYGATDHSVVCTLGAVAGKATGAKSFRVRVAADASGELDNQVTITSGGKASSCGVALVVKVPEEPEPAMCDESCSVSADCEGDLICSGGMCRNEDCVGETDCSCPTATPTPTPTPTPNDEQAEPLACNDYCANTSDCEDGFVCSWNKCRNAECPDDNDCGCAKPPGCSEACNPDNYTNECVGGYTCDRTTRTCRNAACSSETDCTCAVAGTVTQETVTQEAETLPTAGSPIPGFLFLAAGAILLVLGLLVVGL